MQELLSSPLPRRESGDDTEGKLRAHPINLFDAGLSTSLTIRSRRGVQPAPLAKRAAPRYRRRNAKGGPPT